jgi:hypothetical protein
VFGIPVGWYPVGDIITAAGYEYGGIKITGWGGTPDVITIFKEQVLYANPTYDNGYVSYDVVSSPVTIGEAPDSVTIGRAVIARGAKSIARGYGSIAEGYISEVDGYMCGAKGAVSLARGYCANATADYSTAIGKEVQAASECQFVIGENNIVDKRRQHVFIVGNGFLLDEYDRAVPSNAHTLDWSGNAWFQGSVYVGGTGQDDEAAVKLATVDDVQNLIDTKLGVIENGSY